MSGPRVTCVICERPIAEKVGQPPVVICGSYGKITCYRLGYERILGRYARALNASTGDETIRRVSSYAACALREVLAHHDGELEKTGMPEHMAWEAARSAVRKLDALRVKTPREDALKAPTDSMSVHDPESDDREPPEAA